MNTKIIFLKDLGQSTGKSLHKPLEHKLQFYFIKQSDNQYRVWSDKDLEYGTFEVISSNDFEILKKLNNIIALVDKTYET